MTRRVLAGLFVGGKARRLGGVAKGLLAAPDTGEPIVLRLSRILRGAPGSPDVVLVGDAGAYAAAGLPAIEDDPREKGPLGGLAALLSEADRRGAVAVAVAGDLPFLTPELVARLLEHAPGAGAVAPRLDGIWEPLFARYDPELALPVTRRLLTEGRHALFGVLDALGDRSEALPVSAEERAALTDWDTPEDVALREPRP